jgi:hypothetical protein
MRLLIGGALLLWSLACVRYGFDRSERVPFATREGMEVQISEAVALARKPGVNIKVDDIVDDRLVVKLEKEGFIDRIYKP